MTKESADLFRKILQDRINYYLKAPADFATAGPYASALDMFNYAMEDNIECLRQFDYYGEMR